jgi:hypothetical protein
MIRETGDLEAIVANSYLILYPKPEVAAVIAKDPEMVTILFEGLNTITQKVMIAIVRTLFRKEAETPDFSLVTFP